MNNTGVVGRARGLTVRIAALAAALTVLSTRGAMELRLYDEARHDRFYTGANPDPFLRDAADWSGVGQCVQTWATMVSPTFYISAVHWHADPLETLTFYDALGNSHNYTVSGGQQILDSDLWLGWLTAPIPGGDNITSYSVSADQGSGFVGAEVWTFGQDLPATVGAQRMGRNVIDGVGTERTLFLPPVGYTDADLDNSQQLLAFNYESAVQSAVGGDESRLAQYDSGGPLFTMITGTPALTGINYFIYDPGDRRDVPQQAYAGSVVTSVSAYIDAIDAAMAAHGSSERLTVVVVPEPAALMLLGAAGGLLAARRARRGDSGQTA